MAVSSWEGLTRSFLFQVQSNPSKVISPATPVTNSWIAVRLAQFAKVITEGRESQRLDQTVAILNHGTREETPKLLTLSIEDT